MTEHDSFDEAFRRWAGRPPATSGPDAARAIVAAVQAEGGRRKAADAGRLSPAWATLAVAVLVLAAGTASFIHSLPPVSNLDRDLRASAPASRAGVPARDADVVLWLDDGTPVYVFLPDGG